MPRTPPLGFEAGDTLTEFVRVVAETSYRRGCELGVAATVDCYRTLDEGVVEMEPEAVGRAAKQLDVHWETGDLEGWTDMRILRMRCRKSASDILAISHRSYDALDHYEIVPYAKDTDG